VAKSKPRPSGEVRETFERGSRSQDESFVRVRRGVEEGKKTPRRSHEGG
jgi:hypothetical protein